MCNVCVCVCVTSDDAQLEHVDAILDLGAGGLLGLVDRVHDHREARAIVHAVLQ